MLLTPILAELLPVVVNLAAIMTSLVFGMAQFAEFLLEVGLVLGGVLRIGLQVLQVLANLRPVVVDVAVGPAQVMPLVVQIAKFVMNIALLS